MIKPVAQDAAFLEAVQQAIEDAPDDFHLWWLGQSGFLIAFRERYVLLDPYLSDSLTKKYAGTDKPHVRMTERVVAPDLLAREFGFDFITSSHNHTDHLDADTLVPILRADPGHKLVVPRSNMTFVAERLGVSHDRLIGLDDGESASGAGVTVTAVPAAHETVERDAEGRCKFLGYVVDLDGVVVYHSGDTMLYDGIGEKLRPFDIDVALLPINGRAPERRVAGNLNGREAAWLAKEVAAKLVIPCHYEMFEFNTADPRDEFVPECERLGQRYKVLRAGERWSVR